MVVVDEDELECCELSMRPVAPVESTIKDVAVFAAAAIVIVVVSHCPSFPYVMGLWDNKSWCALLGNHPHTYTHEKIGGWDTDNSVMQCTNEGNGKEKNEKKVF